VLTNVFVGVPADWARAFASASDLVGARSGVRVKRTFGPSTKAFCHTGVSSRPSIWFAAD
jgi:hypothetical protein